MNETEAAELRRQIAALEAQVASLAKLVAAMQRIEARPAYPPPFPIVTWAVGGCSCPPGTACANVACPRLSRATCYTAAAVGSAPEGWGGLS